MSLTVLGIDPGAGSTGVVTRAGARLLEHAVVRRVKNEDDAHWLARILDEVELQRVRNDAALLAVESVTAPSGFARGVRAPIALGGLLGTAAVYGAILACYRDAYVVAPAHNGSGPAPAYPPELWGPQEGTAGTGYLRHARSAWDVAGAVILLARVAKAGAR